MSFDAYLYDREAWSSGGFRLWHFYFKSSFENECVSKEEGTFFTLRANAYADDIHPSLTYLTASNQALRYRCSIRVSVVHRLGEEVRLSRG